MAMLLKKVWGSVSSRSNSNSNSNSYKNSSDTQIFLDSYTGLFDQLPLDIFMQILKYLGPKEAAKASAVCKMWKILISDNRLWIFFFQNGKEPWESVVFAETHLRSGYPLRSYYNRAPQLSFMHIYGQREKLTGSVIIDGGMRFFYQWLSIEPEHIHKTTLCQVDPAIASLVGANILDHLADQQHFWMQVKPSTQPIVVSIPLCYSDDTESAKASRRQLKETIYSVLFDMNVPAVCAINQAVLALYAARRTSGIVVNIGFNVTSVVPILRGKVMHKVGVEIIGQGALKLTGYLKDQMQQRRINFESLYTVRELKENLCYVAADYEAELSKDTRASFKVSSEGVFTLSKERFQTGEILFQPQIGGMRTMGLHQAVALCMDHCLSADMTTEDGWFKTVVLAGGSACLPGLPERLEKELHRLLPPSVSQGIKVIPPPYGVDSAWFGGKLVSNLSTFSHAWCMTKKKFRQKSRRNSSFIGSW